MVRSTSVTITKGQSGFVAARRFERSSPRRLMIQHDGTRSRTPRVRSNNSFFTSAKKNGTFLCRATASSEETIICSLDAFPTCGFFEVKCIIRPWREAAVIEGLLDVGIRGLTALPVKGIGVQGASKERFKGNAYGLNDLIDKTSISIIVAREQVQMVCASIIDSARTGEIGDGKIFVYPVSDVVRIRTQERGVP